MQMKLLKNTQNTHKKIYNMPIFVQNTQNCCGRSVAFEKQPKEKAKKQGILS